MEVEFAIFTAILLGLGAFYGVRAFQRGRAQALVLNSARFVDLARVLLDVQRRCMDAFEKAELRGAQMRHEISGHYRISYSLKALPNGTEHELAVSLEGHRTITPPQRFDLLRMLTFLAPVAQLPEVYPFDAQPMRIAMTRVLTPDQTKQISEKQSSVPMVDDIQRLLLVSDADAERLRGDLR